MDSNIIRYFQTCFLNRSLKFTLFIIVSAVITLLITVFIFKEKIAVHAEGRASTQLQKISEKKEQAKKGRLVFFDNFEYIVGRNDSKADTIFQSQGGWSRAKTAQDPNANNPNGYLYTTDNIPGYTGTFPGHNSNQVLAIEALPSTYGFQTAFHLQYGDGAGPANQIPGDVWFQFWLYPNHYGDQLSRFYNRNKFIYPCNGNYPCHSNHWLLQTGSYSYEPHNDSLGDPSKGNMYIYTKDHSLGTIIYGPGVEQGNPNKLGQTDTNAYIAANTWTLVKIHFDTSTTSGKFEAWLKPMGGNWIKVAEWIDGVTPGFSWKIPASEVGGHRIISMPTTIPGGGRDPLYNSWIYMDDFVIATSEDSLPKYSR